MWAPETTRSSTWMSLPRQQVLVRRFQTRATCRLRVLRLRAPLLRVLRLRRRCPQVPLPLLRHRRRATQSPRSFISCNRRPRGVSRSSPGTPLGVSVSSRRLPSRAAMPATDPPVLSFSRLAFPATGTSYGACFSKTEGATCFSKTHPLDQSRWSSMGTGRTAETGWGATPSGFSVTTLGYRVWTLS